MDRISVARTEAWGVNCILRVFRLVRHGIRSFRRWPRRTRSAKQSVLGSISALTRRCVSKRVSSTSYI
eukprot:11472-Eustigmatos_ZCMA.PRE.1